MNDFVDLWVAIIGEDQWSIKEGMGSAFMEQEEEDGRTKLEQIRPEII